MVAGNDTWLAEWAQQSDISARSVLVTFIGDTLVPVGASMWMSQAMTALDVFGFSDRLIRTSMGRLVADEWLANERVGRVSRYHVTDFGLAETARASERIYASGRPDWSGDWTLVFLPDDVGPDVIERLGWNGFVSISPSVLASPTIKPIAARELIGEIDPALSPATATAAFDELDMLNAAGFFMDRGMIDEQAAAYAQLVDRYNSTKAPKDGRLAFGMRTALVHDLRRIRLRWPDPPPGAAPPGWVGETASSIAADLYPVLVERSAGWLSEVLECDYPSQIEGRF